MLTHTEIWRGIDRLAAENGLTASGLAKSAGLDPTTFNKSKRITKQDKKRWPSTESLAKVLEATGTSLATFVGLVRGEAVVDVGGAGRRLSLVSFDQLGDRNVLDDAGFVREGEWDEVDFPGVEDPDAYAFEITDDKTAPCYRKGDVVVVGPRASVRPGNRAIVLTRKGAVLIGIVVRRTTRRLTLLPIGADGDEMEIAGDDIAWLARILWVSQ